MINPKWKKHLEGGAIALALSVYVLLNIYFYPPVEDFVQKLLHQ